MSPGTSCSAGILAHAPSEHGGRVGDELVQRGDRPSCPVLLSDPDERVERHHGQHDDSVLELAECQRDRPAAINAPISGVRS
jgi:hypothetical protein